AGLIQEGDPRPMPELQRLYTERVTEQVLDTQTGQVLADKAVADVAKMNKEAVEQASASRTSASDQALTPEAEGSRRDAIRRAASRYRVVHVVKADDGSSVYVLPI